MALSAETLDELIKPELWDEWVKVRYDWFPRDDTIEHKNYDKRTPGN